MDNYTKHIGKLPPPVELPFADIAKLAARSEEVEIMSGVAQVHPYSYDNQLCLDIP